MKLLVLLLYLTSSLFADSDQSLSSAFFDKVCSQSLEVKSKRNRDIYKLHKSYFASVDGKLVALQRQKRGGKYVLVLFNENPYSEKLLSTPFSRFNGFAIDGQTIWFLQEYKLVEYSLVSNKVVNEYPTINDQHPIHLSTQARGMDMVDDFIYIAHGSLGIVRFNKQARIMEEPVLAGTHHNALAGNLLVVEGFLIVLQGEFAIQDGYNGFTIVDRKTMKVFKTAEFTDDGGVLDAFTGHMAIFNDRLYVNNSGWLHSFDLTSIVAGKQISPEWHSFSETISDSVNGPGYSQYKMIRGNFYVDPSGVLRSCSGVSYQRAVDRQVVKDWRTIAHQIR